MKNCSCASLYDRNNYKQIIGNIIGTSNIETAAVFLQRCDCSRLCRGLISGKTSLLEPDGRTDARLEGQQPMSDRAVSVDRRVVCSQGGESPRRDGTGRQLMGGQR